MSKAQLDTFLKRIKSGKNETQKVQIYNFIKRNPNCTTEYIYKQSLGMHLSTVRARVSELADLGVVKYSGVIKNEDSLQSKLIIVTDPAKQIRQQTRRKLHRKQKAIKTLLNTFNNQLNADTIQSLQLELS